jgi:predicted mannosyl-3-phosphoglycerate phosphatase (HAD superfamily)
MIKILIIDAIGSSEPEIEVYSSKCPAEIVHLEETVDLDGDISKDGNHYYVKTYIPWQEVRKMADSGGLIELVIKAREHAKITERGILEAEYEELSSKMAHLETQISENLENQTKLNKGEDENGNSG